MTNYIEFAQTDFSLQPPNPSKSSDTNELNFSVEGEYQYQAINKPETQYLLVPIFFDKTARNFYSTEILTNIGKLDPVILESY
jgi:hypothetical protein